MSTAIAEARVGTTQLETAPEPKYWHLKTVLSEALESEFAVGEILPNERELAARFGVARATLRQALEQLELEGRLQRRRGVGTTVAPPRFGVDIAAVEESRPMAPGATGTAPDAASGDTWRTDDCAQVVPPLPVSRMLRARTGDPALPEAHGEAGASVYAVRRTRVTHGQPVATELLYVPAATVPRLPAVDDISGGALGSLVLRELHGLELQGQERTVELGSVAADDARRLDRLPGAPVLVVTTRYLAQGGGTAAVAVSTYRADTCRLTIGDGATEALAG